MALQLDDDELIRSFQAGDERVFDMVVAENRDALHRHAVRRLGDAAAADDAVQEVFLRAYRSFGRLRPESRITSWLHHIMVNVCIDEANRRRRNDDKTLRAVGQPMSYLIEPSIEQRLGLDRVDTTPVRSAMDALPDTYQEALTMRFVDELTYEEMAAATGVSEDNARARVSRARSAIRDLLRGVALVPVVGLVSLLRRSPRAEASGRFDDAQRLTESTSMATKVATSVAPAAETITTVATTAHHTVPLITKAVVGIGAVSMLAMTTAPENSFVPPAERTAVTATAVDDPATTDAVDTAPAPAAPATTPAIVAQSTTTADSAGATDSADTDASPDVAAPDAAPNEPAAENPAPTPAPGDPVAEPPVALSGGALSASGISVTRSGPRVDVSGPVTLTVGGASHTGSLSGRLSLTPSSDPAAPQRFDGTLTISVGGSPVEIRLQGFATPLDPPSEPVAETPATDEGAPEGSADVSTTVPTESIATESAPTAVAIAGATRFTITGMFRATNGAGVGLIGEGSFSGTFGPGSLTLSLR